MTTKRSTGRQSPRQPKSDPKGRSRLKIDTSPLTSSQPVGLFSALDNTNSPPSSPPNTVPLAKISLNPAQPRRYFDPEKMQQLVESVRRDGILQPLLVRPLGDGFELVAGERRYRAAREALLASVPVNIREMTDDQATQFALAENLQREDLNPVEETEGILALLSIRLGLTREEVVSVLDRMLNQKRGLTDNVVSNEVRTDIEEVFNTVGRLTPQSFRTHRLPLLSLPSEILEALRAGQIEYTKAKAIARVKDEGQRRELLEAAISQELSLSEIRERVKSGKGDVSDQSPGPDELRKRVTRLSTLTKKSALLEDEKTRQKVAHLLGQIEKLLQGR